MPDAAAMARLAAEVGRAFRPGDTVLLFGGLGAGKTTFVRGYLASLGLKDPVRSPTFNLVQMFETVPPVVHVDLYRVASDSGLGLEDTLESHVTLVEWPDRLGTWVDPADCWTVTIRHDGDGRNVVVAPPPGRLKKKKNPDIEPGR